LRLLRLNTKIAVDERFVLLLTCLIVGFAPIQGASLLMLRSFVIVPFKIDTLLTYMFYYGVIFLAFKTIINRITWDSIALVFFFIISYLISICFFGTGLEDWLNVGTGILLSVSCYIVAKSITDFAKLKSYLNITALLIGVSSFLLLFFLNAVEEGSYSQYYGYITLPAAAISTSVLFEKFRFTHLLNLILCLSVILFSGSRGPFVCFVLFVVIKFLLISGISLRKRIIIIIVVSTLILSILFFFQDILYFFSNIGENKGLSLRLITSMADKTLVIDEGRDSLWKFSIQLLMDNPFFGVGIYNDRILLANLMGESVSAAGGSYPHNIFLEVLLHFGLIIGSIMIISLIWIIYKAILKNMNRDSKDVILIFFAFGLSPLFFSESYLQCGGFFLFLGLCVNVVRNERIIERLH
jgi:O-antigen ligase